MGTAYQHRPLSKFLAPEAGAKEKSKTEEPQKAAEADSDVPDKYRGKSVKDVIEMHQNAERELGRVRNEVGTYRGLVSELADIRRVPEATKTTPSEESVNVSGDELIADPVGTVKKLLQHELKQRSDAAQAEDAVKQSAIEADKLLTEFGDVETIVQSEDFNAFVARTAGRQNDLRVAASGTGMAQVQAARRLLEDYTDYQKAIDSAKPKRKSADKAVDAARKAATEGGSQSGTVVTEDLFYENDLVDLIQKDPAKWRSPSFQREVQKAIKEGRYRKNA